VPEPIMTNSSTPSQFRKHSGPATGFGRVNMTKLAGIASPSVAGYSSATGRDNPTSWRPLRDQFEPPPRHHQARDEERAT